MERHTCATARRAWRARRTTERAGATPFRHCGTEPITCCRYARPNLCMMGTLAAQTDASGLFSRDSEG
eukprot:8345845-Alexandrium_andersonii.AAC.1